MQPTYNSGSKNFSKFIKKLFISNYPHLISSLNNFLERDAKNSSKKNQHFMPSLRNAIKNYRLLTSKEIDILDKILQIMKNPYESNNNKNSKSNKFIKYKIENSEISFYNKCQALYASLIGLMKESGYLLKNIKAPIKLEEDWFDSFELSSSKTYHQSNQSKAHEATSIINDEDNRYQQEYCFLSMKPSDQSNTHEATSMNIHEDNTYEHESNEVTSFGFITSNSNEVDYQYDNDDRYHYKSSNFSYEEQNQRSNDFNEFPIEKKMENSDYLSHSKSSQCDYYPQYPDFLSLPSKWQKYIQELENLTRKL